ncbi:MAG: hypothetical protein BA864_05750 [Desulfuromonadales bacterium C00003093]|nr:MAG: hypothetical protein BA864_05750 [Desulfuromonadales bacterium C00003093]
MERRREIGKDGYPRGLVVTIASLSLIASSVLAVYLIYRIVKIIRYPYSTTVPHEVEIGANIILFGALFFIVFLGVYLNLAVISKTKGHRRTAKLKLSEMMDESRYPTVTVAIFTFNEPTEMVKESIRNNYFNMKYPRDKLQLAVCDDSTDEEHWKPLAEYVEQLSKEGHKVFLVHRIVRKGRKAGAFNELINNYAQTDYVALCDADYQLNEDFLQKTVPFFYTEEDVFAVQTPQYFRNSENTWISKLSMNIQQYFYSFLGTFKDRDDSYFFCGTCGVLDLKKAKAVQMEEKAITEDIEISTEAVTKYGWKTIYVDEVLSNGVGPEIMGQIVGQYMRYSRGNLWSLRQHLGDIILSDKINLKQKVHHFHNNAALAMGVAMLIMLLEPIAYLTLGLPGPNAPILLTLFLFITGNYIFYLTYGRSFREFLYHLFFMNVISIKLTAQFIRGFVFNTPGEFIRTPKIGVGEKSIRKRAKYVFSLFWFEIILLALIWAFIGVKANLIGGTYTIFLDIQSQGIANYLLNFDIIAAISSFTHGIREWISLNPGLIGPIVIFGYFTFWFIGGFYLAFIGGNKPKPVSRITEFVVPMHEEYFGTLDLVKGGEKEKEERKVKPIFVGKDVIAIEEPVLKKEPVATAPRPEPGEKRLSGVKIIARRKNNQWTFFSPEAQVTAKIPDVARKLQDSITTSKDLHLVGELIIEDPDELLGVKGIQDHFKVLSGKCGFKVYDLLYCGEDLKYQPRENRMDLLSTILPSTYEPQTKNVGVSMGEQIIKKRNMGAMLAKEWKMGRVGE